MRGIDSREVNPASDVMRAPDPYGATSPGEFVAAMRALKEWSGLTYRQLQRRAAAVDELLPHSTVAAALSRNTLPREELVTGFVRACGQDEATAAGWLTVRKRIAAGLAAPAADELTSDPGTDEPPPRTAVAEPVEAAAVPVEVGPVAVPVEVVRAVAVPVEEPAADDVPSPGEAVQDVAPPDEPVRERAEVEPAVPSFATGALASTVARRKKDEWVGTHRYDPAVEVPRPAGLRWLVPPIMYRTGWATRVLSAGLVVVLVFVAAAVTVRIIREVRGDDPGASPSTLAEAPEENGPAETGDALDDGAGTVTPPAPTTGGTPTPAPGGVPAQPPAKPPAPKPTTPKPATATGAAANGNAGTFAGVYRIRPAHTGLCVGEGPELYKSSGRTVLGQQNCGSAGPPTILEQVSGSVYRIKLDHPTHGTGCATVDEGAAGDGLLLAGANCGASRKDQQFTLEPVSTPAAGHRIRAVAGSSYCIGVYKGSGDVGVQLIQTRCDGGKHQVFVIEAR
ncbi:RICIN domain-containing protein [Micromonospora sp. NPDC049523]|uniref:RICIN domain-containing protein n=1 Tax=Micromonospora sp. NPDC049523 TaxID=3155921 RepID=UPI0034314465